MRQSFVFVMVFSLLLTTNALTQEIPKGANQIIVKGVSYDDLLNRLLDNGFAIQRKDAELKTVRTEFKKLTAKGSVSYFLDARVKDSVAVITGEWVNRLFAGTIYDSNVTTVIANTKAPVPRDCFKAMNEFAMSLKGTNQYLVVK